MVMVVNNDLLKVEDESIFSSSWELVLGKAQKQRLCFLNPYYVLPPTSLSSPSETASFSPLFLSTPQHLNPYPMLDVSKVLAYDSLLCDQPQIFALCKEIFKEGKSSLTLPQRHGSIFCTYFSLPESKSVETCKPLRKNVSPSVRRENQIAQKFGLTCFITNNITQVVST